MNKLEGNLVLFSVAFFWGVQYVFLRGLPEEISTFAFMSLTYGIGFILVATAFWKEVRKMTVKLVKQSLLMSVLLFASNTLLTVGSRSIDPSMAGFLASSYIIFVPFVMLAFRQKVTVENLAGMALVVGGLLLATRVGFTGSVTAGVLPLLVGCLLFAVYLVVVDRAAGDANPVLLSMGQMGFSAVFSLVFWLVLQPETLLTLPADKGFWGTVLFAALFIRAFTTVMQVYAQRYVSTMDASLILTSETVFALLTGPLLAPLLGTEADPITLGRAIGCGALVCGVLVSSGVLRMPGRRKEAAE